MAPAAHTPCRLAISHGRAAQLAVDHAGEAGHAARRRRWSPPPAAGHRPGRAHPAPAPASPPGPPSGCCETVCAAACRWRSAGSGSRSGPACGPGPATAGRGRAPGSPPSRRCRRAAPGRKAPRAVMKTSFMKGRLSLCSAAPVRSKPGAAKTGASPCRHHEHELWDSYLTRCPADITAFPPGRARGDRRYSRSLRLRGRGRSRLSIRRSKVAREIPSWRAARV